jgi:hypothetical protein
MYHCHKLLDLLNSLFTNSPIIWCCIVSILPAPKISQCKIKHE